MSSRPVKLGLAVVAAVAAVAAGVTFVLLDGKPKEDPLERLLGRVPADAAAAFAVPNHARALKRLGLLHGRFRDRIGGLDALVAEGSRRVGFDLLKPETMATIGLDPQGGTAVAAGQDWAGVWSCVTDEAAFTRFLAERTKRETGDELAWRRESREGLSMQVLETTGPDKQALLALGFDAGLAVVAPAQTPAGAPTDPVAALQRLRAVTPETSLLKRAEYTGPAARRDAAGAALVWVDLERAARTTADIAAAKGRNRDAEALGRLAGYVRGLVGGLSVGEEGVSLDFTIGGESGRLPEVVAAFTPASPGPDYARIVPPDGMFLVSLAVHPTKILPWLRKVMLDYERGVMDRSLKEAATKAGVDLEKDLLPALSGHAAFVFHTFDLKAGIQKLLKDLGSAAQLAAARPGTVAAGVYVGVKDPAAVTSFVEKTMAQIAEEGGPLTVEPAGDRPAWRVRQGETEIAGLAVVGKTFVLSTGTGRLDRALAGLSDEPPEGMGSRVKVAAARRALSPDNNVAVYLSVPTLLKNFPILNLWRAVAGPAKRLGEVALFARLSPQGLDGEVLVTLPPPPPKPAGAPAPGGKPAAGGKPKTGGEPKPGGEPKGQGSKTP